VAASRFCLNIFTISNREKRGVSPDLLIVMSKISSISSLIPTNASLSIAAPASACSYLRRIPAEDEDVRTTQQQPPDERFAKKTGAAGNHDLHSRGLWSKKTPRLSRAGRIEER